MKIYLAADHAGLLLKNDLLAFVKDELHFEVVDCGAYEMDEEDDYPDYIFKAAMAVAENPDEDRAIILGGSGQGEAMTANRIKGVRAALYYGGSEDIITLSRAHNNANVLSLGARFLDLAAAKRAVALWLDAPFTGEERHVRRIQKLDTV